MAQTKVRLPSGADVTIEHKEGASEQDVLSFAFDEYVTNQDPGTVIGRSIAQGIDNLQQAYGSSLEGIGNVLDAESLQQLGGDIVAKNQAQIDARKFREQQSVTDRDGVAGAYDYVAELAGQSAPQMATTLAGAGAGAAIGSVVPIVGTTIGAFAGGFLANMPYFYGSNRERQKEAVEKGYKVEMDEGAAALSAIPQSALDALFGAIGAKFLSTPLMKLQGGILTKATVGAGTGSIIEAPTEIGQTVLERYQAGLPLDNDEALKEVVAAGVGGAVLGGLFGGAGGAVAGIRTPKETKAVEEKEPGERQTFTVNYTNENTGQTASTQVEADNEQQAQEIANKSLKKTAREGTIAIQKPVEPEPAPTPEPEPEVTAEASATFMPRRFVGEGAITAPPFFQQFSPDQYEDGRFIDLETKQDLSDQTFEGGSIRIEKGRPVLETSDNASNTIIDKKASEEGSLVRTNLFKQKAGWKWTKAPDEAPSTIVSVEQGSKHFYTLDFTSSKPLTLKTYPDKKSEPRGRPTTRGKVKLGKVIGEIDIRGKKHSVYDKVSIGEPEVTAGAAPVQTIDFIKGASGNPATNLASKKRRRAGTGEGKNLSLRLEVNGLPIHIGNDPNVGGKSFEGWAEETSAWFTDEEINDAAGWYDSLKDKFTKEFGEERGPKMMLAWLASQQNESPAGGVRNTFRVIDRLTGIKSGKKGGLADAKLEAIFTDTIADKGLDAKLSDFIDAGMGKRTRTFMGDSPDGGMPFVADVHTGRDSGKLDQQTLTRIKRFADSGVLTVNGQPATVEITKTKEKKVKNKVKVEPEEAVLRVGDEEINLVRDLTGSPSKGEYEGISEWGNNLTDYLNSISWKGRSDWIPAEIQAIGWMRTLRQYGLKESDLESSLIENTFRISAEVDYGLGGKITQIYPDFQKLDDLQKTNITEDVLSFIVPRIQQEMTPSAILRTSEFGIGSWEGNLSPSGNFYLMGSEEASNILANSLAWVTEQAGTMQAVIGKGGKNQRAVALVGLPRNEVSNFVNFIEGLQTGKDKKAAKDAEALKGFSTRAFPGQEGIIVFGLTESKAKGIENTLRKFTKQYQGAESLEIQNFSAVTKFTENNWRDDQNGESYIQEIEQSGGTGDIRQRLLRLREQYGQRLAETGQRVAPEIFGGVTIQSRVDEFVKAGKEYLGEATTEPSDTEVTAQVAPTEPGGTFNQNTLYDFITDNFLPVSRKIGVDIVTNYRVPMARYNASQGVIEYNPTALAQQDQQYITAAMREEMIHAAMSKVILQKAKGKKEGEAFQSFMSSLGKSLTPEQRTAIAEVYSGLETDAQFGAEYSRAAIQQLLYGDVTESFITQGPAFTKLKNLLRSVQSYLAKTFGANVTTDPEAAGIIRASAELLQAADPNARPTNQKIVDQSLAYSVSVNPNAEVTSQEVAESGKPPSQKKLNLNFARRYLFTLSSVLNEIHPRLKRLVRDYYGAIQGRVLNYQTRTAPFFKKYRGIKNEKDKRRLKQLLLYSPPGDPEADPLIQEQNKLLRKYDMLNDYNLEVRPVLDELRANLEAEGLEIGYLPEYMPRRIKDLDRIKNRSGNELNEAFKNYIEDRNDEIKQARLDVLKDQLNERTPTEADLKLAGEVVIEIGSDRTAAFEAQQWDVFTMGTKTGGGSKIPGNLKERTAYLDDVIPDDLLDAYEDPSVAMENYIFNIVSATENVKLVGRRFTTEGDEIKVPVASELGALIQQLRANGEISNENADYTVPDIFRMILTAQQGERIYLQIARTFGYGTLLVEFTSTLSQLYDLPFIMLDNGVLGTAGAMFGQRLKGEDFGIDTQQVSAEFASDNRALEKAVRLGLKATGFTKLDQIMKETNLTANYNRYRKLSRGYYKDRNSSNSKKFVAELTAMGYSEQEQVQLIADLKKGNRNSAYIRSLLFNKLAETQPLTQAEMALGIVNNPNLRLFVAMKSFMVKQLNFVKDRMLINMFGPGRTTAQRIKASKELALLLTFMVMAGLPVDALKDFLAGRIGYMSDYLFNGIFRIFGVSRYTAFQIRKEGAGEALLDFTLPVAVQQFTDILGEVGRVTSGERAITESKFVTLLPFSDVINRIFGFQKERERREYMRRAREGERPLLIPAGAI